LTGSRQEIHLVFTFLRVRCPAVFHDVGQVCKFLVSLRGMGEKRVQTL
jgi:hypothetical protein